MTVQVCQLLPVVSAFHPPNLAPLITSLTLFILRVHGSFPQNSFDVVVEGKVKKDQN